MKIYIFIYLVPYYIIIIAMYIQSSSSSAESENSTTSLISANDLAQQQQPYFFSKEGSFVHLHNRYTTTTSVCIMETVNRPPEPGDFQANRPP